MAIPHVFAPQSGNVAASQLDENFTYVEGLVTNQPGIVGEIRSGVWAAAPAGWLSLGTQGATIGDGSSGASARANSDTQALFTLLWTDWPDLYAPVSGGRGATAVADFAAHKTIQLPPAPGRGLIAVGTGSVSETQTDVTAAFSQLPVESNVNKWITGMQVTASNVSGFTGFSNGTWYVIRFSGSKVQFASSLANAQNGVAAAISGTGTFTITHSYTERALGEAGGQETHAESSTEMLAHAHGYRAGAVGISKAADEKLMADDGTYTSTANTLSAKGGNAAMPIMNPWLAVHFIIKY